MSVVEKHAPGSFCWVELGTTNSKAAKAFYSALFGWQPNDVPMGPEQFYTMLQLGGKDVGAMYELDQNMRAMGIPAHWMLYVAVSSADEAAAKAKALGATVMKEPFDVFEAGRMAVIQDPTGATFSIWQANKNAGIELAGEPNALCWSELWTSDKTKAIDFYTKLFGWTTKASVDSPMDYTEISNQGQPMGGILPIMKEWGNVPPAWLPYFMVNNCDATVAKVNQLGGSTKMPPTDIPKVGRFAVVADPQSAVFQIIQMAAHQAAH
jgi:predicted enzyme related to lactoylglutathione lyase